MLPFRRRGLWLTAACALSRPHSLAVPAPSVLDKIGKIAGALSLLVQGRRRLGGLQEGFAVWMMYRSGRGHPNISVTPAATGAGKGLLGAVGLRAVGSDPSHRLHTCKMELETPLRSSDFPCSENTLSADLGPWSGGTGAGSGSAQPSARPLMKPCPLLLLLARQCSALRSPERRPRRKRVSAPLKGAVHRSRREAGLLPLFPPSLPPSLARSFPPFPPFPLPPSLPPSLGRRSLPPSVVPGRRLHRSPGIPRRPTTALPPPASAFLSLPAFPPAAQGRTTSRGLRLPGGAACE